MLCGSFLTAFILNIFLPGVLTFHFFTWALKYDLIYRNIFKPLKTKTMKTITQIQKFFTSEFWNFAAPSNFGWAYNS